MRGPFFMPFFANRYNLIPIIVQQHVGSVPLSCFILGIQPTFDHLPHLKSKIFSNNLRRENNNRKLWKSDSWELTVKHFLALWLPLRQQVRSIRMIFMELLFDEFIPCRRLQCHAMVSRIYSLSRQFQRGVWHCYHWHHENVSILLQSSWHAFNIRILLGNYRLSCKPFFF